MRSLVLDSDVEQQLTPKFIQLLQDLYKNYGVYSFWSSKGVPVYVGMSTDLANRSLSSFTTRFRDYNKKLWYRYILTKTASDAAVLEQCFIATLKPAFNVIGKYRDKLTLSIDLPKWSSPVQCNTVIIHQKENGHE